MMMEEGKTPESSQDGLMADEFWRAKATPYPAQIKL